MLGDALVLERFELSGSTVLNVSALEVSRLSDTSNRLIVTGSSAKVSAAPGELSNIAELVRRMLNGRVRLG